MVFSSLLQRVFVLALIYVLTFLQSANTEFAFYLVLALSTLSSSLELDAWNRPLIWRFEQHFHSLSSVNLLGLSNEEKSFILAWQNFQTLYSFVRFLQLLVFGINVLKVIEAPRRLNDRILRS